MVLKENLNKAPICMQINCKCPMLYSKDIPTDGSFTRKFRLSCCVLPTSGNRLVNESSCRMRETADISPHLLFSLPFFVSLLYDFSFR